MHETQTVLEKYRLDLANYLADENIDIMLLSETYLTDRYKFNVPNYTFYGTKHPMAHGGTGVIIRKIIRHDVLEMGITPTY